LTISGAGTVNMNAVNSAYSGGTSLTGASTIISISASSNALPGLSFTSGPFGTGTVIPNNSTNPPIFQPVGADRVVANAISLANSGFFVSLRRHGV
jgi:autotransporter-associated beta strand protein